jgi:hypothetical protein
MRKLPKLPKLPRLTRRYLAGLFQVADWAVSYLDWAVYLMAF